MVKRTKTHEYEQSVRYTNGLTIFFKSKETIYISDGKTVIIAQRWWDKTRGSYGRSWSPFQRAMKKWDRLNSIHRVIAVANHYEVEIIASTRSMPVIPPGIKIHDAKYDLEGRKRRKRECNKS